MAREAFFFIAVSTPLNPGAIPFPGGSDPRLAPGYPSTDRGAKSHQSTQDHTGFRLRPTNSSDGSRICLAQPHTSVLRGARPRLEVSV